MTSYAFWANAVASPTFNLPDHSDGAYVAAGVILQSSLNTVIKGLMSHHRVTVQGILVGGLSGIQLGDNWNVDTDQYLSIGKNAEVYGFNSYGVYLQAYKSKVVNEGYVWGESIGVEIGGSAASGQSLLRNTGTIESAGKGVERFGSEAFRLENSGTIQGEQYAFFAVNDGNVTIINTGHMDGNVRFYGGADLYDGRSGKVTGYVDGQAGNDTIYGGAGAESLTGGNNNDVIRGGGGADTMSGGANVDTLDYSDKTVKVEATLNTIVVMTVTVGGAAEDRISSFENLIGGSAGDKLAGDGAANQIDGRAGADTVTGGAGIDTLIGGSGKDTLTGGTQVDYFRFVIAPSATEVDTITDFVSGTDKIQLEDTVFKSIGATLDPGELVVRASGHAANAAAQRLIYDASNGQLWIDADGNGGGAAVQVAQFGTASVHPASLALGDFQIV